MEQEYHEAVEILMETSSQEPEPSLSDEERFNRRATFFRRLCPERVQSVPYYHVAGTNGKGSVCELMRASLHSHGRRVGTFTSPHIHTLRERIRVGDGLITRDALVRHTSALREVFAQNLWLLFFDRLLAIALLFFAEVEVEVMILEVGIGGKYDSTNFLERPAVASVITSISYDHEALLGNTLEAIAEQKTGIIKEGSLVLYCLAMPAVVVGVIERTALSKKAKLIGVKSVDLDTREELVAQQSAWLFPDNFALAREALLVSGSSLTPSGLLQAFWPCRFEEFEVGHHRKTILLDGAHNEDGMKRLLERVAHRYPQTQIHVVFGAALDKSLETMLEAILSTQAHLTLVRAPHARAASTHRLLEIVAKYKEQGLCSCAVEHEASIEEALQKILGRVSSPGVTTVCGSIYVAARARQWLAHEHPNIFDAQDWVHLRDD